MAQKITHHKENVAGLGDEEGGGRMIRGKQRIELRREVTRRAAVADDNALRACRFVRLAQALQKPLFAHQIAGCARLRREKSDPAMTFGAQKARGVATHRAVIDIERG